MTKTRYPLKIEEIPKILNAIIQEEHYIKSCENRISDIRHKIKSAKAQVKSLQRSHENNIIAIALHNEKLSDLKTILKKLEE